MLTLKQKHFFLLFFCASFLAGVFVRSVFQFSLLYAAAVFACASVFVFFRNPQRFIFVAIALGAFFGIARFHVADLKNDCALCVHGFARQKVVFSGTIDDEPERRLAYQRFKAKAESLKGSVLVTTDLYTQFSYGDSVALSCALDHPSSLGRFRYDRYLAKEGIYALCRYPVIKKTGEGGGNAVKRGVLKVKGIFVEKTYNLLPEPYASLVLGILVGMRGGMSDDLADALQRVGIFHIVAISGYNIAIIAALLQRFAPYVSLSKRRASFFVLCWIIVLVIMTGAPSSVVRAAVMGGIVIFADFFKRKSQTLPLLIFCAFLMVLKNPFLLVFDVGFQFSFAATIGILYAAPIFQHALQKLLTHWKSRALSAIIQTSAATSSAVILTFPLSVYYFGRISVVALIANMLILWTIPFVMSVGFFAVIASFISEQAGIIIAFLAGIFLEYVVRTAFFLSDIPFASVEIQIFHPIFLFLIYAAIFLFLRRVCAESKFSHEA